MTTKVSYAVSNILDPGTSTSEIVINESGAAVDFRVESSNDTQALHVDGNAGIVRMSSQPSFNGGRNANVGTSGGSTYVTLICNIAYHNQGNHYNTSTGIFTCPVDGVYHCSLHGMSLTSGADGVYETARGRFYRNGSGTGYPAYNYGDGYRHYSGSWIINCSANDQLTAVVTQCRASYSNVSIFLVG